jgi:geranylgeranyl pyrophosphate synthase
MDLYIEESFVILNQFPDSDAKKHLVQLVQYSINRKY